jgi:phosphate starvation-inducible PhoH-like protein
MKLSVPLYRGIESLYGTRDENIRLLEAALRVRTRLLTDAVEIEGDPSEVERCGQILSDYSELIREGHVFANGDLNSLLRVVTGDSGVSLRALVASGRQRNFGKKVLAPKTINQRPAVEAGEKLGFLPGTLQEKIDPYLRPLYDAIYDMLEAEKIEKFTERGVIEVAPLAFMRGRTLNDAFIILDEAQNATPEQMKMVLTRQGFNSKMVVTGDATQIDLPPGRRCGLLDALEILRGVEGISFVSFDEKDVVRHSLVQRIVKAYERHHEASGVGRQLALRLTEAAAAAEAAEAIPSPPIT